MLTDQLPLWYQIAQILRAEILARHGEEPERLPTEQQLAERFAVSVITIRQALKANPGGYAALANYVFDDTRTAGSADCTAAACNATDLAAYDLDRWQENIQSSMPGAKYQTFVSSDNSATTTGNRQLGVLIGWTLRERNTDGDSDYLKNFIVPATNVNTGVTCWPDHICHLAYIEP